MKSIESEVILINYFIYYFIKGEIVYAIRIWFKKCHQKSTSKFIIKKTTHAFQIQLV